MTFKRDQLNQATIQRLELLSGTRRNFWRES